MKPDSRSTFSSYNEDVLFRKYHQGLSNMQLFLCEGDFTVILLLSAFMCCIALSSHVCGHAEKTELSTDQSH